MLMSPQMLQDTDNAESVCCSKIAFFLCLTSQPVCSLLIRLRRAVLYMLVRK